MQRFDIWSIEIYMAICYVGLYSEPDWPPIDMRMSRRTTDPHTMDFYMHSRISQMNWQCCRKENKYTDMETTHWENKELYEAIAFCFVAASEMEPQPRWPEMHLHQLDTKGNWKMDFDDSFVELADMIANTSSSNTS